VDVTGCVVCTFIDCSLRENTPNGLFFIDCSSCKNTLQEIVPNGNTTVVTGSWFVVLLIVL